MAAAPRVLLLSRLWWLVPALPALTAKARPERSTSMPGSHCRSEMGAEWEDSTADMNLGAGEEGEGGCRGLGWAWGGVCGETQRERDGGKEGQGAVWRMGVPGVAGPVWAGFSCQYSNAQMTRRPAPSSATAHDNNNSVIHLCRITGVSLAPPPPLPAPPSSPAVLPPAAEAALGAVDVILPRDAVSLSSVRSHTTTWARGVGQESCWVGAATFARPRKPYANAPDAVAVQQLPESS